VGSAVLHDIRGQLAGGERQVVDHTL
jgi:hypothetical protein